MASRAVARSATEQGSCREAMAWSMKLLRLGGMWRMPGDGMLYRAYTAVLCCCLVCFMLVMSLSLFFEWDDLLPLMDNLSVVFSQLPTVVIMASLFTKKERYSNIVSSVQKLVSFKSCGNEEVRENVRKSLLLESNVIIMYPTVVFMGIGTMLFKPSLLKLMNSANDNTTLTTNIMPLILYPGAEKSENGIFLIVYTYVIVSLVLTWVPIVSLDAFAFNLVSNVTCQFQVLSTKLRKVAGSQHNTSDGNGNAHLFQYQESSFAQHTPKLRTNACLSESIDINVENNLLCRQHNQSRTILFQLVSDHQEILSNAENLCNLLSDYNFTHYLVSSALFCILLYMSTVVTSKAVMIIKCIHLGGVLTRLFIICYISSELADQSQAVSDAAYFSEWHSLSKDEKSWLVLIMARAQRPTRMWAGSFAVMSLPTYLVLIQCAYSYYNVLNTLGSA